MRSGRGSRRLPWVPICDTSSHFPHGAMMQSPPPASPSSSSSPTGSPPIPTDVVLAVRNLAVAFHTDENDWLTAVDDVSFDLKQQSVLGIVGESGCGKSVTSFAIMRLLAQPYSKIFRGQIWFNQPSSPQQDADAASRGGEPIDLVSYPKKLLHTIRGRKIAMIFQDSMSALNPVHRIKKQLAEVYRLHFPAMSNAEIRAAMIKLLQKVQIPDPETRLEAFPHQLSGGMRQRVMIAIALACRPDILIADEPTTALDVTVQAQILRLIKELQQEIGMSIILITHDFGVIAQMCDEMVVMYAGRVAEQGPVQTIIHQPKHPYTQGLLSSIPHLSDQPKTMLPIIEGSVPGLRNMPAGCRFAGRCPQAFDPCQTAPPLTSIAPEHQVACHYATKVHS